MSAIEIAPPAPSLIFTDAAANKVKQLIDEEQNDNLKLRVFVSGGGCSGFQYGFTFECRHHVRLRIVLLAGLISILSCA